MPDAVASPTDTTATAASAAAAELPPNRFELEVGRYNN